MPYQPKHTGGGADVQIRFHTASIAVELWALDTVDGMGWCQDALGAAGPSNKPVGAVGGLLVGLVTIFNVYFILILFCVLSQMRPLRTHTWAYITKIACMGLPDYIKTLINNIKQASPAHTILTF